MYKSPVDPVCRISVAYRPQTHLLKLQYCGSYHPLLSKEISDIYSFLLREVYSGSLESQSVTLGKCSGHGLYLRIRQGTHENRRVDLIFSNILSISVQIRDIVQIAVHDDIRRKCEVRVKLLSYPVRDPKLGIIVLKIIHSGFQILHGKIILKHEIYLDKQLRKQSYVNHSALKCVHCHSSYLVVHKAHKLGDALYLLFVTGVIL